MLVYLKEDRPKDFTWGMWGERTRFGHVAGGIETKIRC